MPRYSESRLKSGFNALAPFYDFFARLFFAGRLMRAQTYFLPMVGKFDSALIVGGGTGRILIEMLDRAIARKYTYLDISEKMVLGAKKRLSSHQKHSLPSADSVEIEFICGSVEILTAQKFDLIVTPFVLDCFKDQALSDTMESLNAALSPRGKWLFTDFHTPAGLMGFASRVTIGLLYLIFNIVCGLGRGKLPDFAQAFTRIGLQQEAEVFLVRGMLVSRIYSRK